MSGLAKYIIYRPTYMYIPPTHPPTHLPTYPPTSTIFCWHSCRAKNFSLSVEMRRRQAGELLGRKET